MTTQNAKLRIAEEAADWLLRLQDLEHDEVRRAFIAWLKHSPRHVEEFLLMSATMRVAKKGAQASHIDVEALLREGADNNVVRLAAPTRQDAKPRGTWRWAVAATALVAAGFGLWQVYSGTDTYRTPIGEQRSVKLSDGSLVYLNTRSRIKVEFSGQQRNVRLLEGEALFVVARDATRSFRVLTDNATVQVLGTQFNVYAREAATTVSVLEGRVQIAPEKILGRGEQADIADGGRVVSQARPNLEKAVAWRQRRLVFQSDSLADIAREFNRYNRAQIKVEGDAAAQRRFTAVFNADEPQALLAFLQADPELRITGDSTGGAVIEATRPPE